MQHVPPHDGIILAGGRGSRLGGVDKAAVDLAGEPLIAAALRAAEQARTLVVVGSTTTPLPERTLVTQEKPTGSGPGAALVAGLETVCCAQEWLLVLSCDLPGAEGGRDRLFEAFARGESGPDGIVLVDEAGRAQWTLGLYRAESLRAASGRLGSLADRPLRSLFDGLDIARVTAETAHVHDIDTWADHAAWQERLRNPSGGMSALEETRMNT